MWEGWRHGLARDMTFAKNYELLLVPDEERQRAQRVLLRVVNNQGSKDRRTHLRDGKNERYEDDQRDSGRE